MIRFAPRLEGLYAYRIHVEDNEGHAASPVYSFRAGEAQSRGFIRVDLGNSRYFAYDDGTSCVPLGYNICWVNGASGGFRYVEYLDDLRAGGGNWTRLWMTHLLQSVRCYKNRRQ